MYNLDSACVLQLLGLLVGLVMGDDTGLLGETNQAMNGMAVCKRAKTQYRKMGCQHAGSLSLGAMLLTLTFPGGTDPIPGIRPG